MYFFRFVVLVFLVVFSSLMLYKYLLNKKEFRLNKKKMIFIYLIILHSIFILFNVDITSFIFLDFSCILAYKFKLRKEALIFSLLNILYFINVLDLPVSLYLVYLIYLIIDYFFNRDNRNITTSLIFIKTFTSSYVYFSYYDYNSLGVLYLVFIFIYLYILLEFSYKSIKEYEISKNDNNMLFLVAHEVKNPIAVCKGYLDMLDVSNKDKINKYLPIIKSEMNRALTIMDDFLDLKRLVVNKDIMDLNLLLEDVKITMNSILETKKIKLEIGNLDDELIINGDYDRLKQVFVNIIKNSCEANCKAISISTKVRKDLLEIVITDDGDGISSKDLKRIGQTFYTTKVKGTGIGVSMSKEIIKLHDGTITYDSVLGKETKVNINIPYEFIF